MKILADRSFPRISALLAGLTICGAMSCWAQAPPVSAQFQIVKRGSSQAVSSGAAADASNVVVWLSPLDHPAGPPTAIVGIPQLVQRNKVFEPHVLVVQGGTTVQFPNKDPFFHNVFSLFNGKRFDLGLYEAGSSRSIRFDRAGVSFLFCNIHEEMSAIIVAVDSPYFALSDRAGNATISKVPDGRYEMHVWYERSLGDDLKDLDRPVTISDSGRRLGTIQVPNNPDFTLAHKNKYGEDYVPPPAMGYSK